MILVPETMVGEISQPLPKQIISPEEEYYATLNREMTNILNSNLDSRTMLREFLRVLEKARSMKGAIPLPKINVANLPVPTHQPSTPPLSVPVSQVQHAPSLPIQSQIQPPASIIPVSTSPIAPKSSLSTSFSPPYFPSSGISHGVAAEERLRQMTKRLQNYISSHQTSFKPTSGNLNKKRKASTPIRRTKNGNKSSFLETSGELERSLNKSKGQRGVTEEPTPEDPFLNRSSLREDDEAVVNWGNILPSNENQGAVGGVPLVQQEIIRSPQRRYPRRITKKPRAWKD